MSRSVPRSKCTRVGCLVCKPHKASGERPISERRALSVEGDLDAIDRLHWSYTRDIGGGYDWIPDDYHLFDGDPYSGHTGCDACWSCIECGDCDCLASSLARVPSEPLRVPIAALVAA